MTAVVLSTDRVMLFLRYDPPLLAVDDSESLDLYGTEDDIVVEVAVMLVGDLACLAPLDKASCERGFCGRP